MDAPIPRAIAWPANDGLRVFIPRNPTNNNAPRLPVDLIFTQLDYHPQGQLVYELLFELPEPFESYDIVFDNNIHFPSGRIFPVACRLSFRSTGDGRAVLTEYHMNLGDVSFDVVVGPIRYPWEGPPEVDDEPPAFIPQVPGMAAGAADPFVGHDPAHAANPQGQNANPNATNGYVDVNDNANNNANANADSSSSDELFDEEPDDLVPTAEFMEYGDALDNI